MRISHGRDRERILAVMSCTVPAFPVRRPRANSRGVDLEFRLFVEGAQLEQYGPFEAIRIEQRPEADPFYVTGLSAKDLLKWADVPRKNASFMVGYQRQLNTDRQEKIRDFISEDPKNIVPGAVIVALRQENVEIEEETGSTVCAVTIRSSDVPDLAEAVRAVHDELLGRLGDAEQASIGIEVRASEQLSDGAPKDDGRSTPRSDTGTDDGPTEEEEGEPDDDAGGAILADEAINNADADLVPVEDLAAESGQQDDEDEGAPPDSYLAREVYELSQVLNSVEELGEDRRKAIQQFASAILKPGVILDGQHRVFGAKSVTTFDPVLPVVLIPGLTWSEQAFHFYVLNNKAVPLKPPELRTVVSTSLSAEEIGQLYGRLLNAGVLPDEAQWVLRMDEREASPFQGMIDFGHGAPGVIIKENVAYQVVRRFMRMPRAYSPLYQELSWWDHRQGSEDQDRKLELFFCFWDAIREKYRDEWDKAASGETTQLLSKVSMLVLQDFVLDALVQQVPYRAQEGKGSPFELCDELKKAVKAALYYLPSQFFDQEWQHKSLDTRPGREFLKDQMQKAVQRQGKRLGQLALLRRRGSS